MTGPRLVVFGYSDVGHACLKFLLDRGEAVAAVFTHEDRPGENLWFPSVAALARERGVPVRLGENLSAEPEASFLASLKPDLILSFYYRNLIPGAVLRAPRLGAFNMHGSLLPRYRGRAPVNWSVLKGETESGATLHVMVEKADAGDIVDQQAVPIGPDDTAMDVQARVTQAAVAVLARQIDALKAGTAPRRAQDPSQATYFGRRTPEEGLIDWSRPAAEIHNLVRAVTHPYPGAFGPLSGEDTRIWKTRLGGPSTQEPGRARADGDRLFVACGDGREIEILQLQRTDGPETPASDFMRPPMAGKGKNE
jgi:methionyl-tRNA formyltransferase